VRARVKDAGILQSPMIGLRRCFVPNTPGHGVGANASQQIGHRFRIAQQAENSLNSNAADGRKEILQIHLQDDALTEMWRGESFHGAAWDEAVRGGMRRNLVENSREYLPLQLFKPRFGRFKLIELRRIFSPGRDSGNAPGEADWFCTRAP